MSILSSSSAGNEKYIFSNGLTAAAVVACCGGCDFGNTSNKSCLTNVGIVFCCCDMIMNECIRIMIEREREKK